MSLRSSLPNRLTWALIGLLIVALMVSTFGCAQNSNPPSSSPAVSVEARYWKVLQEGVTPNSGVLGLTNVIVAVSGTRQDIMFGLDYGLALKSDGTVWSWIINVGGGQQASEPAQESKLSEINTICTGTGNSLALDSDGNVWYWYAFGDLPSGIPSPTSTSPTPSPIPASRNPTPTQVMGLGKVTAISAGQRYSLVLQDDGIVWAWGENEWGQLGDGTTTNSDVPVQVRNLSDVIAISAGHYHSLALKSDGTVWAWGDNESGELGNGTTVSSNVPVQVSGLDGIVAIAAGEAHSLALKKDGTVWSWGNNENGQAGNGTQNGKDNPAVVTPVKVNSLNNVVAIAEGGLPGGGAELNGGMVKYGAGYCLALKSDDTVWTWGASGWYSEPWNNPHNNIPVQINNLSDVKTIAGGGNYAIAIVPSGNAASSTPTSLPGYQPSDEFVSSVSLVNNNSVSVEIVEYTTGKGVSLTRGNPNYDEMLRLLSTSTTEKTTLKTGTVTENGKTITVQCTVPYTMGYILTFDLKSGREVKFNITSDSVWFETDEAIYQASVHADLFSLAKSVISVANSSSVTPSPKQATLVESWTTFTTEDGLASNRVTGIVQDEQGILWVAGEGLTRFDGTRWEIYSSFPGDAYIVCVVRDKQGNLWFGTASDAAYKYTGKEWQKITPVIEDLRPNVTVQDIFVDKQGDIWFAVTGNQGQRTAPMAHGVTRYDGTNWTQFLGHTHITTIFQDTQGNLWFGSNVGIIRYDGSNWQTFTTEDGLADNYVVAITEDSQGNLWFGTWNDGVSRYNGKEWQTFNPKDGLETSAVHCMLKDSRGNLWFGSYSIDGYYGISLFDGTRWQHFDPWPGRELKYHYNVISIFEDNKGDIWFATSIGLVRYNAG
ncbi:MAG: two-component regulator propeller domain-containing protein [Candidatus Omnitrophica bacterium]|nr:two-component regulator propeller domain-containing protein [Candidatus Omnitrophota bacterium]